jgi:hypothetical protein
MKASRLIYASAVAGLALQAALIPPALASRVVTLKGGTVSAAAGMHEITVNGVSYPVANNPVLNSALSGVKPGEQVQLMFSKPPGTPGSQVTSIVVQQSH